MQTILGANGTIGINTAKALKNFTTDIKLVSRNPMLLHHDDYLFSANLTNPSETMKAVKGSKVAYLTVGLNYNTETWKYRGAYCTFSRFLRTKHPSKWVFLQMFSHRATQAIKAFAHINISPK